MPDTRSTNPLHPRIEELLEYLDETRAAFLLAVKSVPASQHNARPDAGRWSLGEILDHVAKVETAFVRLLTKKVADARASGLESETDASSIFASFNSARVRDRTTRFAAPTIVIPAEGAPVADGLAALAKSRLALRGALADANGVALGTISFPHPALGLLNMYQWALSVGGHEARHAEQIRELADTKSAH